MRVMFEINDNTGTSKIIFYQKDQGQLPSALRNFEYSQFMYAKVFGTVRVYKEEKAIVGTHIRKIEKFEEVTNHYLQVFVAHEIRTKGVLTVNLFNFNNFQNKDFQQVEAPRQNVAPALGAPQSRVSQQMNGSSGDALQTIIGLMKNFPSKIVHRDDINSTLRNQFDAASIQRAIDRLLDDGTIYTAHSNDTFILDQ